MALNHRKLSCSRLLELLSIACYRSSCRPLSPPYSTFSQLESYFPFDSVAYCSLPRNWAWLCTFPIASSCHLWPANRWLNSSYGSNETNSCRIGSFVSQVVPSWISRAELLFVTSSGRIWKHASRLLFSLHNHFAFVKQLEFCHWSANPDFSVWVFPHSEHSIDKLSVSCPCPNSCHWTSSCIKRFIYHLLLH